MARRISHAHTETITAMATFPGGAVTGSFDGAVEAWSPLGERLWEQPVRLPGRVVEALAALGPGTFAVVSRDRGYHSNHSPSKPTHEHPRVAAVTLFAVESERTVPEKRWEATGGYYCADFAGPKRLVVGVSVPWDGEDPPAYQPSFSRLQCLRLLCAATGQVLATVRIPGFRMWTMAVRPDHSALALVRHDGTVEIRRVPELDTVLWRRGEVAAGARCLAWRADGLELALPVKGARIRLLDASTGEPKPDDLPGLPGTGRMISFDGFGGLWVANEYNLAHLSDLGGGGGAGQKCKELEIHRLSCCGCDVSQDGRQVAVGDLGGQVILYDTEGVFDLDSHPCLTVVQTPTYDSVRSVAFVPGSATHAVAFGTLGGDLWLWGGGAAVNAESPREPELLRSFGSSIACLDFLGADRLALGLVDGRVALLRLGAPPPGGASGAEAWLQEGELQAHDRGQEVWSLAWSPDSSRLATASEDCTCRVWSVRPQQRGPDQGRLGEDLAILSGTLSGHTAAVTCVDWREGWLATCSDDRTVRIYNDGLELLHVLKTNDLFVTYLSIHSGKLACVTEDGYRSVFDLRAPTEPPISYKKLHLGSIEGCRWRSGILVTCSSDCTVSIERVE